MDNQDIRTLRILEEIEDNQSPSQRDLAKQLNVSLGLVNSFVKRLVNKGYFKVSTLPANKIKYLLTPKGAAEKARLTYEYVSYSLNYYKLTRKKLGRIFHDLESQGVRNIVFYGFDDLAEIAFVALQETAINLVAVVDEKKAGKAMWGRPVIKAEDLQNNAFDIIFITIVGLGPDDVAAQLQGMNIPRKKIMGL